MPRRFPRHNCRCRTADRPCSTARCSGHRFSPRCSIPQRDRLARARRWFQRLGRTGRAIRFRFPLNKQPPPPAQGPPRRTRRVRSGIETEGLAAAWWLLVRGGGAPTSNASTSNASGKGWLVRRGDIQRESPIRPRSESRLTSAFRVASSVDPPGKPPGRREIGRATR